MNLSMDLWHSNNTKVIWHKFALNFCLNTELCWLYFVFVLISPTGLTINPNNQNEKHDQTFIFADRVLKNQTCFFAYQSCCLSFCLSVCLSVSKYVCDALSSGSTLRIFLIFCMRIFYRIYHKVTKPDFGKLCLLSR